MHLSGMNEEEANIYFRKLETIDLPAVQKVKLYIVALIQIFNDF